MARVVGIEPTLLSGPDFETDILDGEFVHFHDLGSKFDKPIEETAAIANLNAISRVGFRVSPVRAGDRDDL